MGCCFSREEDNLSQCGDPTERTTLLGNPVSNSTSRSFQSVEQDTHNKLAYGQRNDEQAAVNRILHQTACNVIDVSAMGAHHLEQREVLDRAAAYKQKLNDASQCFNCKVKKNCLLTDLPYPEELLSVDPPSPSDLNMIINTTEQAALGLQGVKVEHKEDLVVQFGIA